MSAIFVPLWESPFFSPFPFPFTLLPFTFLSLLPPFLFSLNTLPTSSKKELYLVSGVKLLDSVFFFYSFVQVPMGCLKR